MSDLPSPLKSPVVTLERSQFHEPAPVATLSHTFTGSLKPEPLLRYVHRPVWLEPSASWP